MTVRFALRTEIGKVLELIDSGAKEGFLLPREKSEVEELIRKNRVFVAVEGQKLAGIAVLDFYSKRFSELRSVFVLPEFRSKKLGKQLIQFAFEKAKRQGIEELFVITKGKAVDWFEKQGFNERPHDLKIVMFKKT